MNVRSKGKTLCLVEKGGNTRREISLVSLRAVYQQPLFAIPCCTLVSYLCAHIPAAPPYLSKLPQLLDHVCDQHIGHTITQALVRSLVFLSNLGKAVGHGTLSLTDCDEHACCPPIPLKPVHVPLLYSLFSLMLSLQWCLCWRGVLISMLSLLL